MRRAARDLLLALVVVGAGASGCRHTDERQEPPAREAPASEGEPAGTFYEVKKGDTLWSIAKARGLPVDELVEVNGLASADVLMPGQLLFLPDGEALGLPVPGLPEPRETPPDETVAARAARGDATLDWPLIEGILLRDFAPGSRVPHDGLLLAAPKGTPVLAAAEGRVLYAGDEGTAFGRLVILEHDRGLVTVYAHLDGIDVQTGQRVGRGQRIGRVGATGQSESPQLHFQVRSGRTPEDPLAHLPPP